MVLDGVLNKIRNASKSMHFWSHQAKVHTELKSESLLNKLWPISPVMLSMRACNQYFKKYVLIMASKASC